MMLFVFGAMGSGKSAYALMTLHQRHRPLAASHPATAVLATTLDRTAAQVTSRTGMSGAAVRIVPGALTADQFDGADTILIDEAQFLTEQDVEVLSAIRDAGREVICFGLRTDFTGRLFPGSARLIELADSVRQIALEPRCWYCDRQAVINTRFVDGMITTEGPRVALDSPDSGAAGRVTYEPMCVRCWRQALADHGEH